MELVDIAIQLSIALVIVLIGFVLGPFVRSGIIRLSKNASDKGLMTFMGSACNLSIKVIAVVIALQQLHVEMSLIVGAFSAMGLGISLALKNNMANVAAGIQLIFTHPFKVGDYIQIGEHEGRVVRIETMFTTLLTNSNQEVLLPNLDCVSQVIKNYSTMPYRRIFVEVPVSLSTDVDAFCRAILAEMKQDSRILKDPAASCVMTQFIADGSGIMIGIYCFTSFENYWDVLYDLNLSVQKKRLDMHIESCSVVVKSTPNI